MKNSGSSNPQKKVLAALALLAVICIAVAELFACKVYVPELYEAVTEPVRRAAVWVADTTVSAGKSIGNAAKSAAGSISAFWANLKPEPEAEPEPTYEILEYYTSQPLESQLAGSALFSAPEIADHVITKFVDRDGVEKLTGGVTETVYYNQGDDAWRYLPFGTDNIGGYGCGPVALAMVISSMTEYQPDPAFMCNWAYENGYWASGHGTYHTIVQGTSEAYGLHAEGISEFTPDAIRQSLMSGNMLVALMGPGHFTSCGHYIVLRGVTLTGEILVADPNSRERSLCVWDAQLIIDELSESNDNGAPLWVISKPD